MAKWISLLDPCSNEVVLKPGSGPESADRLKAKKTFSEMLLYLAKIDRSAIFFSELI